MLYGNKSLGFFEDSKYALDSIQIPIIKNRSGSLHLEAGKAHGISEGDWFALCDIVSASSESKSSEDPVVLEVTQAGALTSDLKPVAATRTPTQSGLTAIALTCLSLRRFSVCLDLRMPRKDIWTLALQARRSLNVLYTGSAEIGSSFSFYVTVFAKDCYEIRDESNQRILSLPAPLYDLEQNADYLLDIVDHLLRFKLVKCLTNGCLTASAHSFNELFTVHIINAVGKIFQPGNSHPERLIEVQHGDVVTLVVQNNDKEGGQSLHVHLYSMGSEWEIENLLRADYDVVPPRSSNKSEDFQLGTDGQWKKNIKMTVPRGLRDKGCHYCDDIFKVFLTARPTSFMALELPELGNMVRRREISHGDEQYPTPLSEDWVALNFHIRTHFK